MKAKLTILIILVYCGTLLINLPASVAVSWLPTGSIKIAGATGSLWQGGAKEVTVNRKMKFKNIKWNVELMALLGMSLQANVSFDNGPKTMSGKAVVEYGFSGASASDVILDLTSETVVSLLPMPIPAKIAGDFSVAIKEVKQGKPYCEELDGVVIWKNAYVYSELGDVDLGSPNVKLSCDKGDFSALMTQKSVHIESIVNIKLSEGAQYKLSGEITGTDKLAPGIAQSLSWVGPENESGSTVLNLEGKL